MNEPSAVNLDFIGLNLISPSNLILSLRVSGSLMTASNRKTWSFILVVKVTIYYAAVTISLIRETFLIMSMCCNQTKYHELSCKQVEMLYWNSTEKLMIGIQMTRVKSQSDLGTVEVEIIRQLGRQRVRLRFLQTESAQSTVWLGTTKTVSMERLN